MSETLSDNHCDLLDGPDPRSSTTEPAMIIRRCFRHTRWIASCPDCTAWHLAHQPRRPTLAAQHTGRAAAA